tara:strand:+ start:282 stop:611 length:330 start_codon:yes stop_codon:yes gene_type:complete
MNLNDYQDKSRLTAMYPNVGKNPIYPTLGLSGECGEVAEKVKKVIRDNDGIFDKETINSIKYELGDVLWYVSQLASELGLELDDIAKTNLKKLKSRLERDEIRGSGDDR